MLTRRCPECRIEYVDDENKLSIVLFDACLLCRLATAVWEEEGGK